MKEWWERKKRNSRKRKKESGSYTFWDFLVDALFWVPELLFLPLRIIFWLVRGFGRMIGELFDIV
ncbi:hypothetical protein [Ornithinibacillus halophilus]|uniref:Uncharacterized protein n=1 Tax=Ornithinibacillus halophilus TaxID=930117 RepID=A0A1M5MZ83_9BACI|nr:hypothetical protein [Ornithinibacillus halophilus]SHG82537.1 hypothetical protein SAMN05216225_10686 [Ornithinibacillus halophilus]